MGFLPCTLALPAPPVLLSFSLWVTVNVSGLVGGKLQWQARIRQGEMEAMLRGMADEVHLSGAVI